MNTNSVDTEIDKALEAVVSWKPPLRVRIRRWFRARRKTNHRNAKAFATYAGDVLGLEIGEPRTGQPGGTPWQGFGKGWRFDQAVLFIKPSVWGKATHVRAVIGSEQHPLAPTVVLEFYRADT